MNEEDNELTSKRTPKELEEFCLQYKDQVSELNLKAGLLREHQDYKFFIDEVWPLSRFCIEVFDENYQIQPVKGNQGFDAKVYRFGKFEFNIELAYPHDGSKRAAKARNLVKNEISGFEISSPSRLNEIRHNIVSVCEAKSKKDYSDCILLFNIVTGAVYEKQLLEFSGAMEEVENIVGSYNFRAKSVFLYFSPFRKVVEINA